jgi:endonuclease-3
MFAALKAQVGLTAAKIANASDEALLAVTELGGMHPNARVAKLRTIAEIILEHADGNLAAAIKRAAPAQARKLLKRFPGIGDPGADKILLFAGVEPRVALESNGLRVLLRLGYGQEAKSYSTSYRSAQQAVDQELPTKRAPRVRAFHLLRRHGQEICKHSRPRCEECAVSDGCAYFRATGEG